ncbi:MAG: hypothetical protein IT361_06505 [Gemmatimonadaceae bacterium]|nr:hypothetical protein [Gemmatimonadaceae bacterium]
MVIDRARGIQVVTDRINWQGEEVVAGPIGLLRCEGTSDRYRAHGANPTPAYGLVAGTRPRLPLVACLTRHR